MDIRGFIEAWITDHKDIISIRAIEKELGMPTDTLQKMLQGDRRLPVKWTQPMLEYIDKFTESWVFPKKYSKYLKYKPGDDLQQSLERTSNQMNREKRKKRVDYIPSIDKYLSDFIFDSDQYSIEARQVLKLIKETNPALSDATRLRLKVRLGSVIKPSTELLQHINDADQQKEGLEQSTEIYD